jgi:dTDP-4-dehydrorhamnose reductase
MRVLVIGVSGMLGHKLWQIFNPRFETWGTVLGDFSELEPFGDLFRRDRILPYVDVVNPDSLVHIVGTVRPDVIVNAVGIIKQLPSAKDHITSLSINALFPHRLAKLCQAANARLIHISTDCVFSGRKGMYTEDDISDAEDLYGRTKYLGEVAEPGSLTIRTSIIGRELATSNSLVEWFLGSRGSTVRGYRQAVYTGFPTIVLAGIITQVIEQFPTLYGLYQVSSDPISKHDLLCLMRDAYGLDVKIEPDDNVKIDRSLDSTRFRRVTEYVPPSWPELVAAMVHDPLPYQDWRR